MEPIEAARRYFDAWNRHDPAALVALFAAGGTYADPTTGGELTGGAIGDYAGQLFAAFPDLAFEIVSVAPAGAGRVAAEWRMRGTNTGPMQGPPTGGRVDLPGADFVTVEGDRIRSVVGYFDQRAFAEQLGLQALVLPKAVGPVSFGYSTYMQFGRSARPGAFGLTSIQLRSEAEAETLTAQTRRIMAELPQMPGFLSLVTGLVGDRGFTISAWESVEAMQALRGGTHQEAARRMYGTDFSLGGMTSIWIPQRVTLHARCASCGKMNDYDRVEGRCPCGATLEPPTFW